MGTPLHKTAATEDLSIRALAYPMARDTVDGHDIFAVRSCVHAAVQRAREQNQPTLIEAKTYRYRGHSMADPGTYRSKEEVDEKKQLDPIKLLGEKLNAMGLSKKVDAVINEIEAEIQDAVKFAEDSPYPAPETATDYVYV
jgi:pyruvate dehydrogenase E1 component alpha subunit